MDKSRSQIAPKGVLEGARQTISEMDGRSNENMRVERPFIHDDSIYIRNVSAAILKINTARPIAE